MKSFELRINPVSWIIGALVAVAVIAELFLVSDLLAASDYVPREGTSTFVLSQPMVEVLQVLTLVGIGGAILVAVVTHRRILALAIGLTTSATVGILDRAMYPFQAEWLPLAAGVAVALILLDWLTGFRVYRKLQNITPEAITDSNPSWRPTQEQLDEIVDQVVERERSAG